MVIDKEVVKSLNELLQGEYMAVEAFNNFISRIEEENIKKIFQDIQKQHRENIDILAEYIQDIGGRPKENIGMKSKMADLDIMRDLGLKPDTMDIIEKAIEGETKGVNMAEQVLRGNLDDNSRDLVGKILENDRKSIEKLKKLLK